MQKSNNGKGKKSLIFSLYLLQMDKIKITFACVL